MIGSLRTVRPRAREPSAWMYDECNAVTDPRYFCIGAERASYAAYCEDRSVSPPPPRGGPVSTFKEV